MFIHMLGLYMGGMERVNVPCSFRSLISFFPLLVGVCLCLFDTQASYYMQHV